MFKTIKHQTKNWEVSIIELKDNKGIRYKVTRKYPKHSISETKIFKSKKKAKEQFDYWLNM